MGKLVILALSLLVGIVAQAQPPGSDFDLGDGADFDLNPLTETISLSCGSIDHRDNYCSVAGRVVDAYVVRQMSNAPCIEGRTWGYDRRGVWVTAGCRALFEVEVRGHSEDVTCESIKNRYSTCHLGARIVDAYLVQQLSRSTCQEGVSWGIERRAIWVDRGCRGVFRVIYR